jgi:hypothetical protein
MGEDDGGFRVHLWGLGLGLLALAWSAGPLVRYASPGLIAVFGLLAAVAVTSLYEWATEGESPRYSGAARLLAIFAGGGAMLCAGSLLYSANAAAIANDHRCLAIQREMLTSQERRSDDAAMFQAFGCRPQGKQMPSFAAMKAAPDVKSKPAAPGRLAPPKHP